MKPFQFTPEIRTLLPSSVAHRDHEIELLPFELREWLRSLRGDIYTEFPHHRYSLRTHLSRVCPSGKDLKHVTRLVPNQRLSHLAPGGVSRTDYEHSLLLHD
jgi:hypothetical protein